MTRIAEPLARLDALQGGLVLDDPAKRTAIDPTGFHDLIAALPVQAEDAWDAGSAWEPPAALERPRRVVVLGLGGSAIGADVVATFAATRSPTPIDIVRGYSLPAVDEGTLVVGCSFSGNTEEVLSAFAEAGATSASRLALTTGGELAALAEREGVACFRYAWDGPPRSSIGYGVFALLAILRQLGAVEVDDDEVAAAVASLREAADRWRPEVRTTDNLAKQIAARAEGRATVVFGADALAVAATRWAGQLAENAKQWALAASLPEADHNLIEGFAGPEGAREALRVLLLDSAASHPRTRRRVQLTAFALEDAGVRAEVVETHGEGLLGEIMTAAYLGDWVSYYLAVLNGVDPLPTKRLERLKSAMADAEA